MCVFARRQKVGASVGAPSKLRNDGGPRRGGDGPSVSVARKSGDRGEYDRKDLASEWAAPDLFPYASRKISFDSLVERGRLAIAPPPTHPLRRVPHGGEGERETSGVPPRGHHRTSPDLHGYDPVEESAVGCLPPNLVAPSALVIERMEGEATFKEFLKDLTSMAGGPVVPASPQGGWPAQPAAPWSPGVWRAEPPRCTAQSGVPVEKVICGGEAFRRGPENVPTGTCMGDDTGCSAGRRYRRMKTRWPS